ncbi:probable E3 ubiquitin-protein ligase MARCHF10 isoform X3 [Pleurodeles waltl]|uniref:probable E3 ubiquitin-protein ligase MARCHF10 isoform X3 n=1 Tax=Pleurodeles waltl TaxID=8319 RepID=UPI003709B273
MYETWERPKAITNSRHMLEVQHRIDSEYQVLNQASLRKKEYERELIEKKREQQISKQKRRWLTLSSIYSTRSYERPWASGMGTNRQVSVAGLSEARLHPNSKKPAAKLPAIASTVDRNKVKPTSILKNKGLSLETVNPAIQPQILSKRTRLHQRRLPERATLPRAQGPTSSLLEKTPGTEAPGLGGSKVHAGNSDSVSRISYGKKTTSHFSQPNRDVKASEGTTRSRDGVLQLQNSTAPSSSTTSSQAANNSLLVQSSGLSLTLPHSSGASGSSSNLLSGSTHQSPRTSVFNSSILTRTIGTPQASPSTFEANHSSWSPVSGSSDAPPRSPETNSASVSQLNDPTRTSRCSSAIGGFPLSLSSGLSHAPSSSTEANVSPLSHLSGLSYAPPQSMESRISLFRFQEEDFYHSLNTTIGTEDTTNNYLLDDDDNLFIGSPTPPTSSDGNSSSFQTTFSQISSSETGRAHQDYVNVSMRTAELSNGASTQFNMVPVSEAQALAGHDWERPWRSPRTDDMESQNVGPPVTSVSSFNCGEGSAIGVGDNGRRHENRQSASPISIGVCSIRSPDGAQVAHPRPSNPSPPREVALLTRFADTSLLEAADTDGNSRSSASRRPLSPLRSRFSSTSTSNPDPLLDTSMASEFGRQRQGRFQSSFPMAPINRIYEDVPPNSEDSHSTSSPHRLHRDLTQEYPAGSSLQETLPLALLTMSDLHPQAAGVLNRIALLPPAAEKEASKPKADPEKLKRLKESLLEEDSEEEGDLCRICLISGGTADNPLLEPCRCGGSLQFVHKECLTKWLKAKITSGAQLEAVKRCELCRQNLQCDLDDFNLDDFYSTNQQSQGQSELMNSGLYLMLLLHLYEQRYAELLRLTHSRARRDREIQDRPQKMEEEAGTPQEPDRRARIAGTCLEDEKCWNSTGS